MHGPKLLCILGLALLRCISAVEDILSVKTALDYQKILDSHAAYILGISDTEHSAGSDESLSQITAQLYQSLAGTYGVRIAEMDCGVKALKKLCKTIPRKTIPGFVFFTAPPELNPYNKKYHRPIIPFDGNPGDMKSMERRFAKVAYPDTLVTTLTAATELTTLGQESLVVISPKDPINLFTKSVCLAFPGLKCVQLGKTAKEASGAVSLAATTLGVPEERLSAYTLAYRTLDGKFSVFETAQPDNDITKDREAVLRFVTEKSGRAAESNGSGTEGAASASTTSRMFNNAPIRILKSSDFDGSGLDTRLAWVVRVSEATESVEQGKLWDKTIGGVCEGAVWPAEVHCPASPSGGDDQSYGSQLCRKRAWPYVAVFPYAGPNAENSEDARKSVESIPVFDVSEKDLIRRATVQSFPESAVLSIGEAEVDNILQLSLAQNKLSIIVMSDREEPPAVLRHLAVAAEPFATISFLSQPSATFLGRVGAPPTLPALLCAAPPAPTAEGVPSAGFQIMFYDANTFGPMNRFQGLQHFVLAAFQRSGLHELQQKAAAAKNNPGAEMPTGRSTGADISGQVPREVLPINTQSDWANACSSSFRGLCVVGLHAHDEAAGSSMQRLLSTAMQGLGTQSAAFKFTTVDGHCQATFATRFDVSLDTLPRIVVYSPSKGRYMSLRSSLDEASILSFLQSAVNGKAASTAIPQWPELGSVCEYQEPGAADAASGEAAQDNTDMEDLMEEIRREEEARVAARKKEQKEEEARAKAAAAAAAAEAAKPKTIKRVVKKKSKTDKEEL